MPLLAHQGGWDEALFVLAPVGFFAFLLWLANRRASKRLDADAAVGTLPDDGSASD
jgi:cyanate permease